tara:strand:- start:645 stop:1076 length:432 start_codon:yes stop_codon:yes gene_type:complete
MNKKADASITVLILLVIVLLGYSLYVFNTNSSKIISEIKDVRSLNEIYLKEQQIEFYINEAMDMTLEQGYAGSGGFVEVVKENLKRFDKEDISVREDLLKIADEIQPSNVQIADEIALNIQIQLVNKNKGIIITKDYAKKFIR